VRRIAQPITTGLQTATDTLSIHAVLGTGKPEDTYVKLCATDGLKLWTGRNMIQKFKKGDKVMLSPLGQERFPGRTWTASVVGFGRDQHTIRIVRDGNSKTSTERWHCDFLTKVVLPKCVRGGEVKKFIYCENCEGGMNWFEIADGDTSLPLFGWMHHECELADKELLSWMDTAKLGDWTEHRLGAIFCVR
jgi:hypothetical protein